MEPIRHEAMFTVAPDHPAFAGHFPGRPIVPGAWLLAEVVEAAHDHPALADLLGSAPRLAGVKFVAAVGPGACLVIRFEAHARSLRFEVLEGGRACTTGHFEIAAEDDDAAAVRSPAR